MGTAYGESWLAVETRGRALARSRTDVASGVLLCKRHHLLAHNNHWEISVTCGVTSPGTGTGSDYWLIPPPGIDPEQTPIPMPSKSAAMHELLAASAG